MVGEPPKRPLDYPTLPDWNETDRAERTIPDLQSTRKMLCGKRIQFRSMVGLVHEQSFESGLVEPGDLAEQHDGPSGVGHAGRGDMDDDHQAEGIDQDVTLATKNFLVNVVPTVAARRGGEDFPLIRCEITTICPAS